MADLLILISLMFAGAALALAGFAIGQLAERRRWMAWVKPRRETADVRPRRAFRDDGGL